MQPEPHPAGPHHAAEFPRLSLEQVVAARTLFWHNVMREILTSLSVACLTRDASRAPALPAVGGEGAEHEAAPPAPGPHDLFDGRLALLTHGGERIAIADVHPLFACGINTDDRHRAFSVAVECTVFQVRTPDGQVFTLPLHEIRGFHALTPELMRRLEEMSRENEPEDESERMKRPFGFAAFAAQSKPGDPYYPAPTPAA